MKRFLLGMLCAALLGYGLGCGGDDDGGDDDMSVVDAGPVDTVKPVTKMISADEGGTVEAGKAALEIPAGALDDDTEITVKTIDADDLPGAEDIASAVYDFGPDGTTFKKPVTLTLEFAGKAPKDMQATIAWLDGDKWTALADSKLAGGKATATTTHFTSFAVVWMSNGDGTGSQTAGACGDATACGGDLVGTWKFSATCVTLPPDLFADPSNEALSMCKDIKVSADFDQTGTITFNEDDTYVVHTTTSGTVMVSIPKSCLMGASCDDEWEDKPDSCDTSMVQEEETNDASGSYSVDGDTFTLTDKDESEAESPSDFCVKGNKITAKVTHGDGTVQIFVAERQ